MVSEIIYDNRDKYDLEFYDYKNTKNANGTPRFLLLIGGVLLYTVGRPEKFI